jgi:hypothetical protein
MKERAQEVTAELSRTTVEARARFGDLSPEQLNWKPAPDSWSVGQCFDHLITTHSLNLPILQQLKAGSVKPSFWERYSPFSGFFGTILIRSMRPENLKKSKTSPKAEPSTSEIDGHIVERFAAHQAELIDRIGNVPAEIDPERTIITSPLLSFVTYSLDDCFTILVVHGQRHLGQARRVTESAGFPLS